MERKREMKRGDDVRYRVGNADREGEREGDEHAIVIAFVQTSTYCFTFR